MNVLDGAVVGDGPRIDRRHSAHVRRRRYDGAPSDRRRNLLRKLVRAAEMSRQQRDDVLSSFVEDDDRRVLRLASDERRDRAHRDAAGRDEYERAAVREARAGPFVEARLDNAQPFARVAGRNPNVGAEQPRDCARRLYAFLGERGDGGLHADALRKPWEKCLS